MSIGYVLLNIDKDGTPSTRLGPKMGMESRSLSRSLKMMEERGLITRQSDKNDGRVVRVFLTEEGTRMREISKDAVIRFNSAIREQIPAGKLQTTFDTIQKISTIIDENKIIESIENEEKH